MSSVICHSCHSTFYNSAILDGYVAIGGTLRPFEFIKHKIGKVHITSLNSSQPSSKLAVWGSCFDIAAPICVCEHRRTSRRNHRRPYYDSLRRQSEAQSTGGNMAIGAGHSGKPAAEPSHSLADVHITTIGSDNRTVQPISGRILRYNPSILEN